MARCLIVVEDAFLIKSRGLIVLPGLVPQGDERFRVGDPVLLKRPDGSLRQCPIGGIEMFSTPPRGDYPILLVGFGKEDAPIGTEIWSVDSD
jgi:hypothetical protein